VRNLILLTLPVLLAAGVLSSSAAGRKPEEIKQIMVQVVDEQKRAPGMAIGIIDGQGTNVYVHGVCERGKTNLIDGDSLFEIGSITKVFTTALLQDMVDRGEVKLEDPISKYLPASVKTPKQGKCEITLLDLAMHTSGLPSMPDNIAPKDGDDPWADYTVEQMYECLGKTKLNHRIGAEVDYSNFGMGLLGHILALRAGTNYEALVISRICEPLGMNSTRIFLTTEMKARLATGHSAVGPPVKNWGSLALQGDGALYSSANDMVKFLAANMGRGPEQLCASMAKTQVIRKKVTSFLGVIALKIGLGWMHLIVPGSDLVWHNGGTGGYRSYIGFDAAKKCGVIVLANEENDVDDIGVRIVEPVCTLDKFRPRKQRSVVSIDPAIYDHYVGEYQLGWFKRRLTVARNGDHLVAQRSGPMEFPCAIFPESTTDFFYTATDAQIHFVTNAVRDTTGLVFVDEGKKRKGTKVAAAAR
jgi:serine-type D-Ala-D-Ala carboxypeptidase/endopeptidase